jgi:uncharacterized membrane protein YgcG
MPFLNPESMVKHSPDLSIDVAFSFGLVLIISACLIFIFDVLVCELYLPAAMRSKPVEFAREVEKAACKKRLLQCFAVVAATVFSLYHTSIPQEILTVLLFGSYAVIFVTLGNTMRSCHTGLVLAIKTSCQFDWAGKKQLLALKFFFCSMCHLFFGLALFCIAVAGAPPLQKVAGAIFFDGMCITYGGIYFVLIHGQLKLQYSQEAIDKVKAFVSRLGNLPQEDPPDDTDEFYAIRNECCCGIEEDAVTPGEADALRKVAVLDRLSDENERILDRLFTKVHTRADIPLTRVSSSDDVQSRGKVQLKHCRKSTESILQKAERPEILRRNPGFSVEHVRDSFRFKAVVYSFSDALQLLIAMNAHLPLRQEPPTASATTTSRSGGGNGGGGGNGDGVGGGGGGGVVVGGGGVSVGVGQGGIDPCTRATRTRTSAGGCGFSVFNVAKLDIAKLRAPKQWGWRFIALDLVFPNSQVRPVQCSIMPIWLVVAYHVPWRNMARPHPLPCPHDFILL